MVDTHNKYFGIVPIYPIYQLVKEKFNIKLDELHQLLLKMEKDQKTIYLEPINDVTRLTVEEKQSAIYDEVRGYLYYVGRW